MLCLLLPPKASLVRPSRETGRINMSSSDMDIIEDISFLIKVSLVLWLPRGPSGKEPTCPHMRYKTLGFDPWLGKIPWRRKWQPVPGFLPGKSHGQKEPGGLQSMGSQEVQCDWASEHVLWRLVQSCIRKLSLFFFPLTNGSRFYFMNLLWFTWPVSYSWWVFLMGCFQSFANMKSATVRSLLSTRFCTCMYRYLR